MMIISYIGRIYRANFRDIPDSSLRFVIFLLCLIWSLISFSFSD